MRERFFSSQVLATAIGNGKLLYRDGENFVGNGSIFRKKRAVKFENKKRKRGGARFELMGGTGNEMTSEWIEKHIVKRLSPED